MTQNPAVICLTSLSHSGSTVFSMALACHQNTVSLGEVYQVLREGPEYWLNANDKICSCGQPAAKCDYWGPALRKLIEQKVTSPSTDGYFEQAYHLLLDEFRHLYSPQMQAIDTSKGVKHLKLLADSGNIDTRVVFLIRDVRSYSCSQTRLARSENRKGFKKVKGHHWYQMLRWLIDNKKRESLLSSLALPYTTTGYEPFCFEKESVLADTFAFLDLPSRSSSANLAESKHHVLFGNPMRNCESRKQKVHYDSRWFNETGYLTPAAMFPFVMQYNKAKVYRAHEPINNDVTALFPEFGAHS
ncbi:hypothetical protein [Alteromonas sp. C1M14]|uniref:hypothetical protein n=1 Tax=Alteromonas sp. C1M14 TaxID=2841567 RepID=UPI001C0A1C47|nr:hypothetical protein [Alteromonas sp. C1M14]MBU2979577.1 hypothetical protein [Alteromonas sp. C1M14]